MRGRQPRTVGPPRRPARWRKQRLGTSRGQHGGTASRGQQMAFRLPQPRSAGRPPWAASNRRILPMRRSSAGEWLTARTAGAAAAAPRHRGWPPPPPSRGRTAPRPAPTVAPRAAAPSAPSAARGRTRHAAVRPPDNSAPSSPASASSPCSATTGPSPASAIACASTASVASGQRGGGCRAGCGGTAGPAAAPPRCGGAARYAASSVPSSRIRPASGRPKPHSSPTSVDLPDPEGPGDAQCLPARQHGIDRAQQRPVCRPAQA